MKWNDVEMIDGEFYVVDVTRWRDNEPNEWVFAYKESQDYVTGHYVAAKISCIGTGYPSIYDVGHVCRELNILNLRPATPEDMRLFWDYLNRWGYRYCLNTKNLRYVGGR